MKHRIKKIGVFQTSKVAAIILFFIALVIMIPLAIIGISAGDFFENQFSLFPIGGGLFIIIMPIFYGVFGFVVTAISCLVYNLISKWTGGIEIELEAINK